MVGVSSARLRPGDPCWILIDKGQREGVYNIGDFFRTRRYELFQAEFIAQLEASHPAWKRVTELPYKYVKAVRAKLTDKSLHENYNSSLPFWDQPLCDYAVLSYSFGLEFMRRYVPEQL